MSKNAMQTRFIDIELERLIHTGKSRAYKGLARKPALIETLITIYTIISNSIDSIEELEFYQSVVQIKREDNGTILIPIDTSLKIFIVLLLHEEVVEFLPLQISEKPCMRV